MNNNISRWALLVLIVSIFYGCGGGGTQESAPQTENNTTAAQPGTDPEPQTDPDPQPVNGNDSDAFATQASTARFLNQATFGPTLSDIQGLTGAKASEWFIQETQKTASMIQPILTEYSNYSLDPESNVLGIEGATYAFWRNSIGGDDQLRQRMAFALSELLVVSNGGGEVLTDIPEAVTYYQDLLIEHAFGNYRDLLEAVTYSPAMGHYLTYMGSEKGDPVTGRMPDENYAREILQLFSIGVVELNQDGSVKTDGQGNALETYSNVDITGLARVFTGLNLNEEVIEESLGKAWSMPMQIFDQSHSELEKTFLGTTIAANTDAETSIDRALDHIFAHSNVAPFISKQLIQRLVTSNPSPQYVQRVAHVFDAGSYNLPDGQVVGTARRGDLAATLAAILFDAEARNSQATSLASFGKVREPILRFIHWARAFGANEIRPEYLEILIDTGSSRDLAQHPYRAPSVFNFFRPGYVLPGSASASQGLVAPEMQIVNASSTPGYTNFMTFFVFDEQMEVDTTELQEIFNEDGINLDARDATNSFRPDYSTELALANDPAALTDHLDLLLTYNAMSQSTKQLVKEAVQAIPLDDEDDPDGRIARVMRAIIMVMTSTDYLVQR